jgi:hypothetical protein
MIETMSLVVNPKGEPGYENRFRNRPISGGRDLFRYGDERLPALHSPSPTRRHCWTVHGPSHYLWVIFAFQVVGGLLLLVNRYVPLAVALLAPVLVNILTFHVLMAPAGLPMALFVAILWVAIFIQVRPAFSGLFQSRWQPRV